MNPRHRGMRSVVLLGKEARVSDRPVTAPGIPGRSPRLCLFPPPVCPQGGAAGFFPECLLLSQRDAREMFPLPGGFRILIDFIDFLILRSVRCLSN